MLDRMRGPPHGPPPVPGVLLGPVVVEEMAVVAHRGAVFRPPLGAEQGGLVARGAQVVGQQVSLHVPPLQKRSRVLIAPGSCEAAMARATSRTGNSAVRKSRWESFPARIQAISGSWAAASASRVGHW